MLNQIEVPITANEYNYMDGYQCATLTYTLNSRIMIGRNQTFGVRRGYDANQKPTLFITDPTDDNRESPIIFFVWGWLAGKFL